MKITHVNTSKSGYFKAEVDGKEYRGRSIKHKICRDAWHMPI